ncbi:hypothetical protein RvY_08519-2 [Ramazzottius varieornatus]|uniref:Uncharacterized protein n=1 Tax=Ramazzottius varieornatus TaxID=947166 RepID=A0A1D1VE61_RAMVA|nr:hypothetical protein RvY_08519-2 [Ramazzottius varieornatus]
MSQSTKSSHGVPLANRPFFGPFRPILNPSGLHAPTPLVSFSPSSGKIGTLLTSVLLSRKLARFLVNQQNLIRAGFSTGCNHPSVLPLFSSLHLLTFLNSL